MKEVQIRTVQGDAFPLSSVRQDPSTDINMFRNRILDSSLQRQHLVVNRHSGTIVKDLFKLMKRGEIDPRRAFDIEFENEDGFDAQGLTREYMEIVMTKIRDGTGGLVLFEGEPDHMVPVHKEEYLQSGYFKYVGKAIALSIIQGGVGFHGMSRALAYYLVSGNIDEALPEITLSDVPDLTVQMCLEELEKAEDEETLSNIEARDDIQFLLTQAGFANELLTLKNRGRAVQHILLHHVFKVRKDEIEDIRKGLDSVCLTEFLMANEHCIKLIFPLTSDITYTANQVIDAIAADQHGSLPLKEKEVVEWFKTYIKELEHDQQDNCNQHGLSSLPTLQQLIKFIFGDSKLSKSSPIKIAFKEAHFPDPESCFGIIYLPLNHDGYQTFRAAMNTCINC